MHSMRISAVVTHSVGISLHSTHVRHAFTLESLCRRHAFASAFGVHSARICVHSIACAMHAQRMRHGMRDACATHSLLDCLIITHHPLDDVKETRLLRGDSDSDSDEEAMPAGTKWTEAHGEFFHEDSADDDE